MGTKLMAAALCTFMAIVAAGASAATFAGGKPDPVNCAVSNGRAYCWGSNDTGQLGNGTTVPASTPQLVALGDNGAATAITAGSGFACTIQNGGVYCWGATYGLLPVPVPTLESGVTEIAAGQLHACAIQNGQVKCWGHGYRGQLGNGTWIGTTTPTNVVGIQPADAPSGLTSGNFHSCVIKTDIIGGAPVRSLYCWGSGDEGELATNALVDVNAPVRVEQLSGVTAASAGNKFTCALSDDLYCWGKNHRGQLGNGTLTPFTALPTPVQTSEEVTAVMAGVFHACLSTLNGRMYCWGSNDRGALGQPFATPYSTVPVQIAFEYHPLTQEMAAGNQSTCAWILNALSADEGSVAYCWGAGTEGQLGNGTSGYGNNTPIPQQVYSIGGTDQTPDDK